MDLRAAMSQFATGVTVVTAATPAGEPLGSTANSVTSVSLSPPLLLVWLNNDSDTLRGVLDTKAFAINVLSSGQHHLARTLAGKGAHHKRQHWERVPWSAGSTGSPLLGGALVTIECRLDAVLDGGDHRIVLGEVAGIRLHGDGDDGEAAERAPLLFFRGAFHSLPAPAPAAEPC
ncbi:MAG TPA: flavin reductase family protein, partial [Actinomycetota bacterium]